MSDKNKEVKKDAFKFEQKDNSKVKFDVFNLSVKAIVKDTPTVICSIYGEPLENVCPLVICQDSDSYYYLKCSNNNEANEELNAIGASQIFTMKITEFEEYCQNNGITYFNINDNEHINEEQQQAITKKLKENIQQFAPKISVIQVSWNKKEKSNQLTFNVVYCHQDCLKHGITLYENKYKHRMNDKELKQFKDDRNKEFLKLNAICLNIGNKFNNDKEKQNREIYSRTIELLEKFVDIDKSNSHENDYIDLFEERKKLVHKGEKIIDEFFIVNKKNNLVDLTPEGKLQEKLTVPHKINNITADFLYRIHGAFEENKILKEIFIPNNIKCTGTNTFRRCINLEQVNFEKKSQLEEIGNNAFEDTVSLKQIQLPKNLKMIGNDAFNYSAIKEIHIPKNVEYIGDNAFESCNLKVVIIPKNIKKIGYETFRWCENLEKIIFEDDSQLEEISDGMFDGCCNLKKITIPNVVKRIGDLAFNECKTFKQIVIPKNVQTICYGAFANCTNLEQVTFEDESKLEQIGIGSFSYCKKLKNINIPKNVKVDRSAFIGCDLLNK